MIPSAFLTFFAASAGAGAALVGLLFVAVSLAPEQIVTRHAPLERQAVAGSAFTALVNAFFLSLVALVPRVDFGLFVIPIAIVSLLFTVLPAWALLRVRKGWVSLLRRVALIAAGVALYGLELSNGISILTNPTQDGYIYALVFVMLGIVFLGLTRAWELLGAQRYGFGGWLNPLRDVQDSSSDAHATADAATRMRP
ncbi:MAG TPA: hypothetical protein VHI51_07385 [Ktedonobacterales bacterium]|jgi:hypothetical protein|nr:hypothetical protein [Ktedonobacterales bacterium]